MMTFKDITPEDKEIITRYTFNSSWRNCDLSFSNLCSWRFMYNTVFAEQDGFLILKFWNRNGLAYMMPVGEGDIKHVLEEMIEDSKREGGDFYMLGASEDMKRTLDEVMPGRFSFRSYKGYADYLYLRTDLSELAGKKFQPKRNHINKFLKTYPDHAFLPIRPESIPECLRLADEWCKANNCDQHEGTGNEHRAIIDAFSHFEQLGLTGGILRVNGKIVAFTFGMPICKDTFGVHVEKADITIEGAYATINYEFANTISEQYTYINREEDLGIEGLRKAKLSYHPAEILEKGMACLINPS